MNKFFRSSHFKSILLLILVGLFLALWLDDFLDGTQILKDYAKELSCYRAQFIKCVFWIRIEISNIGGIQ